MMLFDGLTVVVNPHRLLSEPSFKAFVNPIVDERGTFSEGHDLEAAIMEVGELGIPSYRAYIFASLFFLSALCLYLPVTMTV